MEQTLNAPVRGALSVSVKAPVLRMTVMVDSGIHVAVATVTWEGETGCHVRYDRAVAMTENGVEGSRWRPWRYAAGDDGEAYLLARAGVLPVQMDGTGF